MSTEQMEYVCPICRRRTVVNAKSGEEETVFCPRCEIEMKPYITTSELAAAAANAPTSSGGAGAPKSRAKSTKSTKSRKTADDSAPKKASKSTRTTIKAAAAVVPVQPDFGEFRCQCCGYGKIVALGTDKPAGGWRCPACFIKLTWLKA